MSIEDAFKKAGISKHEKIVDGNVTKETPEQNQAKGFETPGKKPIPLTRAEKEVFGSTRNTFHVDERAVRVITGHAKRSARGESKT